MTTLRELTYMIEANTQGLEKAFPSIDRLSKRLESLEKTLTQFDKNMSKSMQTTSRAAQGQAQAFTASSNKIQGAMKRNEAALLGFQTRVDKLRDKIKSSGGESRLLANTQRAYNTLEKTLKNTATTTDQAALAKAKFGRTIANVERELNQQVKAQKAEENAMKQATRAALQEERQIQKSADTFQRAMKKREVALTTAQSKMNELNKTIGRAGGDSKLIDANAKAYKDLERTLRNSKTTSDQVQVAQAKYNATLTASKNELSAYVAAQRNATNSSRQQEAAMMKQENAVERTRIKYLDLLNALQLQGAKQARIDELTNSFQRFEGRLTKSTLSAKEFSKEQNRINAEIAKVRRNEGFTDISKRMSDLATSAQVALGPLSGVASRITAITTLANRNTIAIAGVIGGFIALGASMTAVIRAGGMYEQQMHRINGVLVATRNRANTTAEEVDEIAKAVGNMTMTTQTAARDAAAALLTLRNMNGELLESALLAAQGMSLIGRGDIVSNTRRLTRILEDPANNLKSLSEAGVQFNAVEEEQIKLLQRSGNLRAAQTKVMDRLAPLIAAAKNETAGLTGAWDTLMETITTFYQEISQGNGVIEQVTNIVKGFNDVINELRMNTELVNDISQAYHATLTILGKIAAFLGVVLLQVAKHLDSITVFFTVMAGMKLAQMVFGLAKAFKALALAIRATAYAEALATAGIPLAIGAASVALYELYDRFTETSDAGGELTDMLRELEKQMSSFNGEVSGQDTGAYADAIKRAREQINEQLGKGIDASAAQEALEKALTLGAAGDVKAATKTLQDFFGVVEHTTDIMTEHEKAIESAANAYVEFRDENLGFMKEIMETDADLQKFNKNYEHMIEVLKEGGKTQEQAEAILARIRENIVLNGDSTKSFINDLNKQIAAQERELDISRALGAEKAELQAQQEIINKLYESGLISTANYTKALEELRAMGPEFAAMADEIEKAAEKIAKLAIEADKVSLRQDITKDIEAARVELDMMYEAEVKLGEAVAVTAAKQDMLNKGIEEGSRFWNEQLELVRQLAQIDVAKGHIEAMKAMKGQAVEQQNILDTLFYSETTAKRMLDLRQKEYELTQKYGSLIDANAQRELQAFKALQERQAMINQWQEVADVVDNTFQGIEDAIVKAAETGKVSIKDMVRSMLSDILRLNVRTLLRPFQDAVGKFMQNRLGMKGFSLNPLEGTKGPVPVVIVGAQGAGSAIFNPSRLAGNTDFPPIPGAGDVLGNPGGGGGGAGSLFADTPLRTTINPIADAFEREQSKIQDRINSAFGGIADSVDDAAGVFKEMPKVTAPLSDSFNKLRGGLGLFSPNVSDAAGQASNFAHQLTLSAQDVTDISKVAYTEVAQHLKKLNPEQYVKQMQGVVDTMLNRVADPRFPNSVQGVLNQHRAFSKITGPARLNPYGSVANTPMAPSGFQSQVQNYLGQRAMGAPSSVGGALNYLNPKYSDQSNLDAWGYSVMDQAKKSGSIFGVGGSRHFHGTDPSIGGDLAGGVGVNMEGFGSGVQTATDAVNKMGTKVGDVTGQLTSSFDGMKLGVDQLGTQKLPMMSSSLDRVSQQSLVSAAQQQATTTAQTQTMGVQATTAGAQIQQLGTSASIASTQMSAGGAGGLLGSVGGGGGGGLLSGIGKLFGFARGGFTGGGSASSVAGFVHGKEYVFDSESTQAIGVQTLDNIRKGAKNKGRGKRVFKGDGAATARQRASNTFGEPQRGANDSAERYKIVNVMDPSVVGDYLATSDGEKLVMNIMRRNGLA